MEKQLDYKKNVFFTSVNIVKMEKIHLLNIVNICIKLLYLKVIYILVFLQLNNMRPSGKLAF